MDREQDLMMRERAARVAWAHNGMADADVQSVELTDANAREDWPLLSYLLGGLMLALVANTFVGLMPA